MAPQVEPVTKPVTVSEGPHWDHSEQALYFVSITDKVINKYVPASGLHTAARLDAYPTFIIPIEGKRNHFVVGLERKIVVVEWSGENNTARVLKTVTEVDQDHPDNLMNDAKADPRGRLFAGTRGDEYEPGKFHSNVAALYRIDVDGSTHQLADRIDMSNGLCWDAHHTAFYYIDSFKFVITRYDYDVETGNISNPKVVFTCKENGIEGVLDGMTIDTDGNLWVANFDGSQVLNIDPRTGKIIQRLPIPARQVTSVTFGGRELDELYVTSASINRGEEQKPPCGAVFRVTGLGVKGYPSVKVRLD